MFIVEGIIGAGKSTLLTMLGREYPALSVGLEPMHAWQGSVFGQSLLTSYYHEPKRWAYTMESVAMVCRAQEHRRDQANTNPFRLVERSIYSGHYCFALNGYREGFFTELEWAMYEELFRFTIPGHCKPPHGFIYLRLDPHVAYERMRMRDRYSEKQVSLSYLKQIHERHEEFLIEKKNVLPEIAAVPLLVLDVTNDFQHDAQVFADVSAKIIRFMHDVVGHDRGVMVQPAVVSEAL